MSHDCQRSTRNVNQIRYRCVKNPNPEIHGIETSESYLTATLTGYMQASENSIIEHKN
jgi:hypothetical protein